MMQPGQKSQYKTFQWKGPAVQDAVEILGLDYSCREVPTSADVVLAAQLKLRRLRRELSARLSNSRQVYQAENGSNAKVILPTEHIWVRIRRVQAARDELLWLRRRLSASGTRLFSQK